MDAATCPDEPSPRRTRLYTFPGGVLEMTDYGEDDPGFYLEFQADRRPAESVAEPLHNHKLPQRVSGAADIAPTIHPVPPADAETCGRALRSLRAL